MAEYIAEYRRKAAYFRQLAANTADAEMMADLHYLANDYELEATKLEEAFGLSK